MQKSIKLKLRLPAKYDPVVDGVSQGLLLDFMSCRQKAYYRVERLQSRRPSKSLQFGELTHRVLQYIYKNCKSSPDSAVVCSTVDAIVKEYQKENTVLMPEWLAENCTLMCAILPQYFNHWKKDFTETKWLGLEKKFKFKFNGVPVPCVGRRDGEFEDRSGQLSLFETKTKSFIDEEILQDLLHFDFQDHYYIQSLISEYGRRPKEVVYNILRRPGNRRRQNETMLDFGLRVAADIKNRPDHYFIRFQVSISSRDIDDFQKQVTNIIMDFYYWWKNMDTETYRNTNFCQNKYGTCPYLPICAHGRTSEFTKGQTVFPELEGE